MPQYRIHPAQAALAFPPVSVFHTVAPYSVVLLYVRTVSVQPAELLRHPSIENHFAMGRMPADIMHSYGLCSECTDLAELFLFYRSFKNLYRI